MSFKIHLSLSNILNVNNINANCFINNDTMKRIEKSDVGSLNGDTLLEIHLKSSRIIVGYVSSFGSAGTGEVTSKGMIEYLVYRLENEVEDDHFVSNYYSRMIPFDHIEEVFIK